MSVLFLVDKLGTGDVKNNQYFSARGYANDNATSLREAAPTMPLSTSQYKCPILNPQSPIPLRELI
ncbi:MAG: hypothetical protein ACYTX0_44120 [Nostoc sp.]